MTDIPKITLEQWAAFRSVVEEGSFLKAAEALHKSQSTISYAIARLNELLPSPALQNKGRKAVLTDLGEALYRHACYLLDQACIAEQVADRLAKGWESQLTLAADALTPMNLLLQAIERFSLQSPQTRITVLETSLSGTDEALLSRKCDIALSPRVPPGFMGDIIFTVSMIPVAHHQHPLANIKQVTELQLRGYRQIVVRDSGIKREQNVGWLGAEQRWTVSHFATSLEALRSGLGFAFVPAHRVAAELKDGSMVRLDLAAGGERQIPLYAIQSQPQQAGPAATALTGDIKSVFASAPDAS